MLGPIVGVSPYLQYNWMIRNVGRIDSVWKRILCDFGSAFEFELSALINYYSWWCLNVSGWCDTRRFVDVKRCFGEICCFHPELRRVNWTVARALRTHKQERRIKNLEWTIRSGAGVAGAAGVAVGQSVTLLTEPAHACSQPKYPDIYDSLRSLFQINCGTQITL
jgi:hypothetical protein